MIKVGIATLMMEAAGLYETWLKICQTIERIYHETSYLHYHPRGSSDLRQNGRTPRPACNYPDRSVPRDCLRRYGRYSVTNVISGNDFSKARKRNKPWPAPTHICTLNHSVRQCKHGSTGAECLACSSVTESVFHSYETDSWIYSKKDTKETVLHTRWTSHCKHQVSELLQRRPPNDLLSTVVSSIHLLPYICGKT